MLVMFVCRWGAEPLWAVSSDSFVVGCGFPSSLPCAQHFHANPDRRRRQYSSLCGTHLSKLPSSALYRQQAPLAASFSAVVTIGSRKGTESCTCCAGQYSPGCGMAALQMSWTAAEYLHLVLSLNRTSLPPAALFLIRYQQVPLSCSVCTSQAHSQQAADVVLHMCSSRQCCRGPTTTC